MAALENDADIRPFNPSGYELLDHRLASHGELTIWSLNPVRPQLGDTFTVERQGRVYELAVCEMTPVVGGWTAKLRIAGLV